MKRFTTLAALVLSFAAAGSAFADDITVDTTPFVSQTSRAGVLKEMTQFKRGANPWSISYNLRTGFQSLNSRADVQADLKAARASGELAAMTAEDSGSAYMAQAVRLSARHAVVLAAR